MRKRKIEKSAPTRKLNKEIPEGMFAFGTINGVRAILKRRKDYLISDEIVIIKLYKSLD